MKSKPWIVERWDQKPGSATYKSWVFVTSFDSEGQALDYVKKVSALKELLAYRYEKQ